MKSSRMLAILAVSLAPLFAANVASAQQFPPPVWTDILTSQGFSTMASGNYYNAGSGQAPKLNTNLAGITPTPNTLTLPSTITSLPGAGGPVGCGLSTNFPVAYIESNLGGTGILNQGGIKGVGFLGSFNSPHPFNNTFARSDAARSPPPAAHSPDARTGLLCQIFIYI